jgi:hypothetical protein
MLNHLQQKWKVNGWRLVLIIATFALGGSLCGYAGRKLMPVLRIEHPVAWTLVYILLVTILWPLSILIISIPLGQFPFFTKYLYTIGARLGLAKKPPITMKKRIAVFASGTGTNAARLIQYSKDEKAAFEVALVACNKPGAGVLNIAAANRIPALMIEKETFFRGNAYLDELAEIKIDFIVLAGFLWKIPNKLVGAYRNRIINIHPALLPNYG